MTDTYHVTFVGHREIERPADVEKQLEKLIFDIVRTKAFVEFYVGNDGEFDIMATSVIRHITRRRDTNIEIRPQGRKNHLQYRRILGSIINVGVSPKINKKREHI